jgi:hypothetical protein
VTERLPKVIRGIPGAANGFSPNAVAGCLVLFIPLQVMLLGPRAGLQLWGTSAKPWMSRAILPTQFVLLLLTAGTLALTQSRGAWTGLVVALGALLLWRSPRSRLVSVSALCVLGAVALRYPHRLLDLVVDSSISGIPNNVPVRLELWSRALDAIQDVPLTGMGMNAFRKVMPALYPSLLTAPDFDVVHAHNHLLQASLDIGVPGLIAYAAVWLVSAALLVLVHCRSYEPVWRSVAAGLGGGLIAHFVFNMTDAIPLGSKVGVLFWLTLALIVGLHNVLHREMLIDTPKGHALTWQL